MSDHTVFGRLLAEWDQAGHTAAHAAEEAGSWFHREHPYPDASQAPAAMPVNLKAAEAAQPEENLMSLLDTIKNDVAAVEAKLEGVDEEALGVLNAVMANPETAGVLKDLSGLTACVGIPAGTINGVAQGLKTILSLYADPVAPEAPAEPAPAPAAA